MNNYPLQLSETILLKAKAGEDTTDLRLELYYLRDSKLERLLHTDELKASFWCNIYNAFVIIMANEQYRSSPNFNYKRIKVARAMFSLNDIEFKILRLSKVRGMQLIHLFCSSKMVKKLAVKRSADNIASQLQKKPFLVPNII